MSSPSKRRAAGVAAAALTATLAAVPAATPARAGGGGGHGGSGYTTNCPRPESLVRGTPWHTHKLAPGVKLIEGRHHDSFEGGLGTVDMHVLSVDVTTRHLHFRPLLRRLAMRTKLSRLAAGKSRLVAATNTGFFDFQFGTPLGPVVSGAKPLLAYHAPHKVIGLTSLQRVQAAQVALNGVVRAPSGSRRLDALNVLDAPTGLTVYTHAWGSQRIPLPRGTLGRYVANGRVTSNAGRYSTAPQQGFLLVARGTTATDWLTQSLHQGDAVSYTSTIATNGRHPFAEAFAVGTQVVANQHAVTGLRCRRSYPQPARTAVGFADHGKRLIIAVIADHPGTSLHGLDNNQAGRVMADLGATQAYEFDGSGSAELLARLRHHPHQLSLRNYPSDGGPDYEREMPVGLGIFYSR